MSCCVIKFIKKWGNVLNFNKKNRNGAFKLTIYIFPLCLTLFNSQYTIIYGVLERQTIQKLH